MQAVFKMEIDKAFWNKYFKGVRTFGDSTIATCFPKRDRKWTDRAIFEKPGIKTQKSGGQFYASSNEAQCCPRLYEYRLGTVQEAEVLGWQRNYLKENRAGELTIGQMKDISKDTQGLSSTVNRMNINNNLQVKLNRVTAKLEASEKRVGTLEEQMKHMQAQFQLFLSNAKNDNNGGQNNRSSFSKVKR